MSFTPPHSCTLPKISLTMVIYYIRLADQTQRKCEEVVKEGQKEEEEEHRRRREGRRGDAEREPKCTSHNQQIYICTPLIVNYITKTSNVVQVYLLEVTK